MELPTPSWLKENSLVRKIKMKSELIFSIRRSLNHLKKRKNLMASWMANISKESLTKKTKPIGLTVRLTPVIDHGNISQIFLRKQNSNNNLNLRPLLGNIFLCN